MVYRIWCCKRYIARDDKELTEQPKIIKVLSDDKPHFAKGKFETSRLNTNQVILSGTFANSLIENMKSKLKNEYYRSIRAPLKTELNAKNKLTIHTYKLAVKIFAVLLLMSSELTGLMFFVANFVLIE